MKHIFIINPAAGKKDSRQRVYAMAEALKRNHNLDVECMLTKSRGHATALTRAIAETGDYVRFYACGGDGTVNEIANGIASGAYDGNFDVASNTENAFAEGLGYVLATWMNGTGSVVDGITANAATVIDLDTATPTTARAPSPRASPR